MNRQTAKTELFPFLYAHSEQLKSVPLKNIFSFWSENHKKRKGRRVVGKGRWKDRRKPFELHDVSNYTEAKKVS